MNDFFSGVLVTISLIFGAVSLFASGYSAGEKQGRKYVKKVKATTK